MAKTKTIYVCQECGRNSPREMGRCPACGAWNSFVEEVVAPVSAAAGAAQRMSGARSEPQRLSEVTGDPWERLPLPMEEFARVLGGGVVPGSIVLIGGEPGIGKCLTADTRILDPFTGAYLPITDWADTKRAVLSVNTQTLKVHPASALAFHRNGVRSIVEVKTRLGRTLRCTPEHPVLTPEGWQPVNSLSSGNRIAAPRALSYFGKDALPDEHVKLIAYLLSDGSAQSAVTVTAALPEVANDLAAIACAFGMQLKIYERRGNRARQYRFTNNVQSRMEARKEFAANLYTLKEKVGISWAEWARRADINYWAFASWRQGNAVPDKASLNRLANAIDVDPAELAADIRDRTESKTIVARFLQDIGLRYKKAADKRVPDCVFTLPREQLALFLKTLFTCDGSVFINKYGTPGISYSTISRQLAEDVQHLLLRFGFVVRLRTKRQQVNLRPYTAYELQLLGVSHVQRFLTDIGIMGRHKACKRIGRMEVPRFPSTHFDTIPTGERFWADLASVTRNATFAEIRWSSHIWIKNRRHERPLSHYLVEHIAEAYPGSYLSALAFGDVYWDEIESITPAGEEEVYDISVPGSANFVANDIIVHNSTLLLEVTALMADTTGPALYVSGEESARQIKMRAERLSITTENLFLVTETNLDAIFRHIESVRPGVLVVDSIQTTYSEALESAPGSVTQVRHCAGAFQQLAKESGIPVFLVGHVTKEGSIAGPRVLEHIVDTVLYLEGDAFQTFRLLRSVKNRFGATSEVGVFEMQGAGMVEVPNPSEAFLAERVVNAPGSAIVVTIEGTRPLLAEVQALATTTSFANPRRTANGVDMNRLLLITAVLTKRSGMRLSEQDIFVNVIGGLRVDEPAADLAIAIALVSSSRDRPLPADMAFVGEIGLSGELRAVSQLAPRLNEAAKLGFRRVLIPKTMRRSADELPKGIQAIPVRSLDEAVDAALRS